MSKGLLRSTKDLRDSFAGGIRADFEDVTSISGGTLALGGAYHSRVTTASSGAEETVTLPAGTTPGQRKLVTFLASGLGGDAVRVQAEAPQRIASGLGNPGTTQITQVDLTAADAQALFEYAGTVTSGIWSLVYASDNTTVTDT